MILPHRLTIGVSVAATFVATAAMGEEPLKKKQLPTREACQLICVLGTTKPKLEGTEKDQFNACANAKLCVPGEIHYYAHEHLPEWYLRQLDPSGRFGPEHKS